MLLNSVLGEDYLRIPCTARRSNQCILNEISPKYSLEGLMLKLKLPYFVHMMWRADSFERTLMLWKVEGRRKGRQRMRWLDGITGSTHMGFGRLWLLVMVKEAWGAVVRGIAKSQTPLGNWTELNSCGFCIEDVFFTAKAPGNLHEY